MPSDSRTETVSFRVTPTTKRRLEEVTNGSPAPILRRCAKALTDGAEPGGAVSEAMTDEIDQARAELATVKERVVSDLDAIDAALAESHDRLDAEPEAPDTSENRDRVAELVREIDGHLDTGGRVIPDLRTVRDLADVLAVPREEAHRRYRETRPTLPDAAFQEQRAGGRWDEVKAHIHDDTPADRDGTEAARKMISAERSSDTPT